MVTCLPAYALVNHENESFIEEEEEVDIDLEDPGVQDATTKNQVRYQGMRKKWDLEGIQQEQAALATNEAEEVIDIDLEDLELQDSTTKQLAFDFRSYVKLKQS